MFGDFRHPILCPEGLQLSYFCLIWKLKEHCLSLRKVKVYNIGMEDQHSDRYNEGHSDQNEIPGMREPILGDCWNPMLNESYLGIQHQLIDANNFELKPALISMVRHLLDDLNAHFPNFLELCGIIKMNEVDHNAIKLKLFPFLIRTKQGDGSITYLLVLLTHGRNG